MAFRSKSRRIGGVSLTTLFGILLISFCAFFGFRTLFSDLNQNIGVEALAAAFGALFVLLPTKILMDQENDNKVEGEKRTAVFNLSLGSYRKLTQVMFKVLLDEKIEEQELQDEKHLQIATLRETFQKKKEPRQTLNCGAARLQTKTKQTKKIQLEKLKQKHDQQNFRWSRKSGT